MDWNKNNKMGKLSCIVLMLLFGVLFSGQSLSAQNPQESYLNEDIQPKTINKAKWEEITNGISYQEAPRKEKKKREMVTGNNNGPDPETPDIPNWGSDFSLKGFAKVLGILILIGLTVFLMLRMMGGTSLFLRNKSVPANISYSLDDVEEQLIESDLDRFIREALEQKNYRLAIRLYYLSIIKELAIGGQIKWKKDKTNKDYLREMRDKNSFPDFKKLTRSFERIWYGDSPFNDQDFNLIRPEFQSYFDNIQKAEA